jgi:hypothetical protein
MTPPEGVIRVLIGKRIVKEAWEIELERRAKARTVTTVEFRRRLNPRKGRLAGWIRLRQPFH